SRLGFGSYRVDDETPEHRQALRDALAAGVNLVDTSTNYTDGGSERMIGEVLREVTRAGEGHREEIVVVSTIGYVQGEDLERAAGAAARRVLPPAGGVLPLPGGRGPRGPDRLLRRLVEHVHASRRRPGGHFAPAHAGRGARGGGREPSLPRPAAPPEPRRGRGRARAQRGPIARPDRPRRRARSLPRRADQPAAQRHGRPGAAAPGLRARDLAGGRAG